MKNHRGFTLVELLVVVAIIGVIASLAMPEYQKFIDRAQSVTCINNLRQVGIGVLNYVGDNDNAYPIIEPNPDNPVYNPEEDGVEAKPMLEALQAYGVNDQVLKCPTDLRSGDSYYSRYQTSYQWRIILDDENAVAPKIYGGRRGAGVRVVKPSRVTICTDYEAIHSGRLNRLYADGHVSKPN